MTSNGWLASVVYWATTELKYDLDQIIWKTPISLIMLLLRQQLYVNGKPGITLQDQEAIDSGEIDKKLREKNGETK